MTKLSPCLWFDGQAEEAAEFYTKLLPDSHIDNVSPGNCRQPLRQEGRRPDGQLHPARRALRRARGGPDFKFNEAVSFVIDCEDQAEVDRYWDALIEGGGEHGPCGWLKDRDGLSWQVVPKQLYEVLEGPDSAGAQRAMEAMLQMGKLDVAELEAAYAGKARRSPPAAERAAWDQSGAVRWAVSGTPGHEARPWAYDRDVMSDFLDTRDLVPRDDPGAVPG